MAQPGVFARAWAHVRSPAFRAYLTSTVGLQGAREHCNATVNGESLTERKREKERKRIKNIVIAMMGAW